MPISFVNMDTTRMLCLELISLLRPSLPKQIIVGSYLYSVSAISFYVAVSLSAGFEPLFPEEKDKDYVQFCTNNSGAPQLGTGGEVGWYFYLYFDQVRMEWDHLPNQHLELTLCLMKYQVNEAFAHCNLRGFQLSRNAALHPIVKMLYQSSVKRKSPGSESPASLTTIPWESRQAHHVSYE